MHLYLNCIFCWKASTREISFFTLVYPLLPNGPENAKNTGLISTDWAGLEASVFGEQLHQ